MKRLNGYRMMMLVGIVAAFFVGGESARADFTFGEPTNLGPPINNQFYQDGPYITVDGLEFYCARFGVIFIATRATTDDDWGKPVNIGNRINIGGDNFAPCVSLDGLQLYFTSNATDGYGLHDLWVATREEVRGEWGTPENIGLPVNSSSEELFPVISADGLELYFSSGRSGGYGTWDVWIATRQTTDDDWGEPVNLGPRINSPTQDGPGSISADGLMLFLHSNRPGGSGDHDIWVARRARRNDPWEEPTNLGPNVNSPTNDMFPTISFDGRWLYFSDFIWTLPGSVRPGGLGRADIWKARVIPIVDLNGDEIVDSVDMCIMVDHWGTDNSLCDIGPMPWGDGVVDVEDLVVLAEHLFEDHRLVAHWELDEETGNIAYDSVGEHDGTVHGEPLWQPTEGKIDGALQFDGVDDYVSIPFVLNPTDGDFSVVAWLMGDVPGQIVLSQVSQAGRGNWLCTDSVEGCLMTELKGSGRPSSGPLLSEAKITDGTWHRIGLVWDGSYRRLYVDGAEVAKDAAPLSSLEDAYGGLYFGAGSDLSAGTFFSGLIDDVRIYNRVIEP